MKKLGLFLLLQFVTFNAVLVAGTQDYQNAWTAFGKNDRVEARNLFNKAALDADTKADALLSLCCLDWSENKLDAAFDNFCKFYESSANPYPYLYSMSGLPFLFESDNLMPQKKVSFLEKIVADPKMNGTLKAIIYSRLGSHYANNNNQKKAKELYAKMGALSHWQVLGSFDNTSGSGFAKDWGAVSKATTNDTFKNKVDADVKWYTPTCNKPNNWFYFDYYFELSNTIQYAQTFVTSPVDQEIYLRAGTSGSLKVWVNDELVSMVSEERNCDLDIYATKVKLSKGNNRILVQIGQSEISGANFMIRLTDIDANPIPGLVDVANYTDYAKAEKNATTALLPFFAEEFFTEKVKQSPANPLNSLLLGETYLRNDKAYEATKALKVLETMFPNSSLLAYRLAEAYTRAKNQTDYDKEMENIKRLDPNSFIGLQESFNEAVKSEKYTDAIEICNKVKGLYGESMVTEDWEINLASHQKRYNDVIAMAKTMYKKYPERADLMNLNYMIEKNVTNNPKSSVAVVENFCKNYFNTSALETLSKVYIEQGNADKGIAALKLRIDNMPYATGYIDNLCSELFRMQRYKEALVVNDQILALSPYLPNVYNTRGYIYKSLKDDENAKESFRKSIYYGPTSYDSRSQLRLLENKKELSELFPKNDISDIIAKAPTTKEYPQDNSVMLLNDYQLVFYPEGAKEYRYEVAVKILNQSGIENWKEYNISYNGNSQKLIIDKAEVFKANGTKGKAETDNDNNVVFTNLEVNDVLHLVYRTQDLSTGKLSKHLFSHFSFQYGIPSILNRYSILAPKDKSFDYVIANGKIDPTITEVENMKLYQWETTQQPSIKDEPYMSAASDISPVLYYSSIPNWKYISDWYKDLTYSKFNTDYVLKETVAKVLKGKENVSPLEKAKLFYNYILENITYSNVSFMHGNFIPQKASRTITTRLGDCKDVSTLFVALCQEVGINANLVLISTRNYGNSTMVLPANDFNHCIAQLNIDNKKYYLELTDNMLPFGAALLVDLNSEILPIPLANEPFGDKLIRFEMPFRPKNQTKRTHIITLNNNDMQIVRQTIQYAAWASSVRNRCRYIGSEEQLKNMNQDVASEFSVPVKVTDLKYTNLDNLADSLIIDYKLDVKNAMQDVAGMKILTFPWTEKQIPLEAVTEETRKYPLELWSLLSDDTSSEEITINLPKGKQFVEIPQNIHFECANASYDLTYDTKVPGKLIARRRISRKAEQVTVEQYSAFREFLNHVGESDNKQYAIK